MFITFEGIDGSGKTTQIGLLSEYFEKQGKKVIVLREPGGTPFSESIREILLHSKENISPLSELFLFNAARANLVENVIKPALEKSEVVICDRFYDSTTAYQGYGRGLPVDDVMYCNMMATESLIPDLTFYIDIPLDMSHERNHKKIHDRMESSGDDFFKKVIVGFNELADSYPDRIKRISGTGSVIETHTKIINIIRQFG